MEPINYVQQQQQVPGGWDDQERKRGHV